MGQRRFVLFCLSLLGLCRPAVAGDDEPPPKAEATYARMPWHLVDTWWDTGEEPVFESLAVDVTISDDVSSSVNLYIAPIGLGHLGKIPFYGGIQTQSDGTSRQERRLRKIGPGLLFSMWGERRLEAIRPSEGGLFQSSGHEGDFVSVRRPYAWAKGQYTYRLSRMDRETIGGETFTWVGAFVYSHERDENVFVGALRFPGTDLPLGRKVANFVEVYGTRRPVSEIPKLTIAFGPPVVNGKTPEHPTAVAIYPKGVPDYADTVAQEGSLVINIGVPVAGREKRKVELIGKAE